MFLQLIKMLTWASIAFWFILIVNKIISNKLALAKFKRRTRNLPVYPEMSLLGNHAVSILIGHRTCRKLQKYHQQLGKTIICLQGDLCGVSTVDLDLIKFIVKDESGVHMDRGPVRIPAREIVDSIMTAPANEWQQLRRAIAPALTPNKFKTPNVQREIEESIERLIALIEKKLNQNGQNQLFDIDDLVVRYSLTIVFKCFYKQDNLVQFDDPNDFWTVVTEKSLHQMSRPIFKHFFLNFDMFFGLIDWFVWNFTTTGSCRRALLKFSIAQTKLGIAAREQLRELKREAKDEGLELDPNDFLLKDGTRFRRNMIDYIIDQYLDGKLSKKQYLNNSCFIMAAADRTAADCIVHTIYLLSIDQKVQDKLRESIQKDGADSEYLDWVLKESLRLLPPASIGCSRTISHDIELSSGHLLPKGTFVLTNSFVIHRLKEYWGDDVEEFKPERWGDTSHHHPMQYLPFGFGPRGCPGKQFALHEMKMLFTALLTRYKFSGEPQDDAYEFDQPYFLYNLKASPVRAKIIPL